MVALLGQISAFLTTPEGSLIYHLILVFSIGRQDIVVAIGPVNDRDVVVLQLTGKDVAGVAIIGEDPVIIINKGKPKK